MIEMTMSEYARHMLLKHFEEEAAKQGIKIVDKKSKAKLITDNVVKLNRGNVPLSNSGEPDDAA